MHFPSHSVIAAMYLSLFFSSRQMVRVLRSQRNPKYRILGPKGTDFEDSQQIPRCWESLSMSTSA